MKTMDMGALSIFSQPKLKTISLIYFSFFLFTSCATTMKTSGVYPENVNRILIIPPITAVGLVSKGNHIVYDEVLSRAVARQLVPELKRMLPQNIEYIDIDLSPKVLYEVHKQIRVLSFVYKRDADFTKLAVPPLLDSLLRTSGADYALTLDYSGYTRTPANRQGELAKTIAVPILTLGLIGYSSIKSFSSVECFIIDRRLRNFAFYNTSGFAGEPSRQETIDTHMERLFKGYFIKKSK